MRMISRFCLLFLALTGVRTFKIVLDKMGTVLSLNSSTLNSQLQLILSINATMGTEIKLFSEALSPKAGQHVLKMVEKGIQISPAITEEEILINDFHERNYWLALTHKIRSENRHFLPIEIGSGEANNEFLLPMFNIPMAVLPENSLYRCGQILFSIQSNSQIEEMSLFSKSLEHNWQINQRWDNEWRHFDKGLGFGVISRPKSDAKIIISLSADSSCSFQPSSLPKSTRTLNAHQYYSFDQVLESVPELPIYTNEDL